MTSKFKIGAVLAGSAMALFAAQAAQAEWKPTKPVEFLGAAGAGGGTDIFNRTVQSIIQKYNLLDQPILVTPKGGGSGAEAYVYVKSAAGDPHKLVFGTSNLYTLPMVAKVAFKHTEFVPVAAMAFDEFILWNKGDSPYNDYKSFTDAAKAANGTFKMPAPCPRTRIRLSPASSRRIPAPSSSISRSRAAAKRPCSFRVGTSWPI